MSITQRNRARAVPVAPSAIDALRQQTFAVLEFTHDAFEELRDLAAPERVAAAVVFRDAFAVLDAVGWGSEAFLVSIDVPLTPGHVEQLRACRRDLAQTLREGGVVDPVARAYAAQARGLDVVLAAWAEGRRER